LAFLLFLFLAVLALSGAVAGISLWQAFGFVLGVGALSCIVVYDSVPGVDFVVIQAYQKSSGLSM
jgi:hypothetical protein